MKNRIESLTAAKEQWAHRYMTAMTESTMNRAEAEIAKIEKAIEREQAK